MVLGQTVAGEAHVYVSSEALSPRVHISECAESAHTLTFLPSDTITRPFRAVEVIWVV